MDRREWISRRGINFLFLCLVCVVSAGVLTACEESEEPNLGVTVDLIMDQPKDYYGEVAIVSGEVDDIFNPGSFTIGGELFEEEMLVIRPPGGEIVAGRPGGLPYFENDVVQVKGIVRAFDSDEIEADFDVDLETDVEEDIDEGTPVLIAQTIHLTPRRVTVVGETPITDPTTILKPAEEPMDGRRVYFEDLTVDEVLSDTTVFVRENEQHLLIWLGPAAASNVPEGLVAGHTISLAGTIYPVPKPAELERRFGLDDAAIESLVETGLYVRAIELTGRTQAE